MIHRVLSIILRQNIKKTYWRAARAAGAKFTATQLASTRGVLLDGKRRPRQYRAIRYRSCPQNGNKKDQRVVIGFTSPVPMMAGTWLITNRRLQFLESQLNPDGILDTAMTILIFER